MPAACASIDGPDIAKRVFTEYTRLPANAASMEAPPKQFAPQITSNGVPVAPAITAARYRCRNAPSAANPSDTRAPAESR